MAPPKKEREIIQRVEFIDGTEIERTKQTRIGARSFSRTQSILVGFGLSGFGLLIWDRLDEGFAAPNVFGTSLPALIIVLTIIGVIGRETFMAILDYASNRKEK